jgi:hypothetical protein
MDECLHLAQEPLAAADAASPLVECLIGCLHGQRRDGGYHLVYVYRAGPDYRLRDTDRSITCLPSVEDIAGVKREATQAYGMWNWVFEAR